ncbi:MAG: family 16 glycosylhydrolase [Phycisphaerales bacterium]|nr:family 16 glycosylhydrolase [Planctomycetota bacterium]MCH8507707.1 family 16 glycosylhydrolase [Phycisphaerales bacterium]
MDRKTRIALALTLCGGTAANAQWTLYWADEFEGNQLNPEYWEAQIGTGSAYGLPPGWGNNELQYYTNFPENVSVSDGKLTITARRQNFAGHQYTSARIRTLNKVDFKWGRVEARMKIPGTSGVWPAFWMLPTNSPYGGWAAGGEIDIMESVNQANRVHGTIHFGGNWPNNTSIGGSINTGTDYSQGFHEYAIEWEPNQIRWYLDGQLYYTANFNQWFSSNGGGNPRAPFDNTFHLLLNVAVGGDWPGSPNASAQYPQTLEVEYVRVYRREQRAFEGQPRVIPGQIEAEHYDEGYPGEAYHDNDVGNNGGAFRDDDVDIQVSSEGGYNIGWIENGEWIEYTVDVQAAGTYLLEARVASPHSGGSFRFEVDGEDRTGPIPVPNTSGWQTWTTTSGEIALDAGLQTIRFAKNNSPNGFNVNWFRFTGQSVPCSPADLADPFGELNFFDVAAYLNLFNSQDPAADLNNDGVFNFFDLAAYIALFNEGCP